MSLWLAAQLLAQPVLAEAADPLIGRVNHAGYNRHAHCTGFVVAGGHLVTAAHCMPRADRSVHFLAGYDRARFVSHIEAPMRHYRMIPGQDIVLLCNALPGDQGLPVSDRPPLPADRVRVKGYSSPRSHMLQTRDCEAIGSSGRGRIEIGCPLSPGTSGAPVMLDDNGTYRVVGVVSATSHASAVAHVLKPEMLDRCN